MSFKKVKSYAKHVDMSSKTIRKLIGEGLPHIRLASGVVMIETEKADEWFRGFEVGHGDQKVINEILEDVA